MLFTKRGRGFNWWRSITGESNNSCNNTTCLANRNSTGDCPRVGDCLMEITLMPSSVFQNSKQGLEFRFQGGQITKNPARIEKDYTSWWAIPAQAHFSSRITSLRELRILSWTSCPSIPQWPFLLLEIICFLRCSSGNDTGSRERQKWYFQECSVLLATLGLGLRRHLLLTGTLEQQHGSYVEVKTTNLLRRHLRCSKRK